MRIGEQIMLKDRSTGPSDIAAKKIGHSPWFVVAGTTGLWFM
jgi:hypothetical protein